MNYHSSTHPTDRSTTVSGVSTANRRGLLFLLAMLYSILVVYGSLYPFSGWADPHISPFSFLGAPVPEHLSRADLLTNFLAYLPLGVLLTMAFRISSVITSVAICTAIGSALSFTMESIQTFLPSRTSSKVDFLVNIAGTAAGALIGLAFRETSMLRINLRQARDAWFEKGAAVDVALLAAAVWAGSQLSPFVPSMDVSSIADGLRPLRMAFLLPGSLSLAKTAAYALNIAGLGLLVSVAARRSATARLWFVGFAGAVLLIKPMIVTRQLAPESLCGLAAAFILLLFLPRQRASSTLLAMALLLFGYLLAELAPSPAGGGLHTFNWIPFAGQLDETVSGFGSILDTVWPFVALASLSMLGFGRKRGPMIVLGSLLVAFVFACEWMQTSIAGRYGDITPVLLTAVSWSITWTYFFVSEPAPAKTRGTRRRSSQSGLAVNTVSKTATD